jgi:hypothetical protein
MKILARVIGATLIVLFGLHGMYRTVVPAMVLDVNSSKSLESFSAGGGPAAKLPFVKAVQVIDAAAARGMQRCEYPVSLERIKK